MKYSEEIFKRTRSLHGLRNRELLLLNLSARLHKAGLFISNDAYHKHSAYLISHSDIPGISAKEKQIAALVARYHRKAYPKAAHTEYESLDPESKSAVNKLAAILRLACGMAESCGFKKFYLKVKDDYVLIKIKDENAAPFDRDSLTECSAFFCHVFSRRILFRH
jgi:exopolyphosphatase/guanosine-5'-triphosphate,3'-diphosphate pyrophosphatase